MKTTFKILFGLFILSLLYIGCEKTVMIELPEPVSKVVIEGIIENGQKPWVVITRNAGYFETVDSNTLTEMIVTEATVVVSDGQISDTCILSFDPFQVPFLKFIGNNIIGEVGKRYNLSVTVDGQTYTASTTITTPIPVDSLTFREIDDIEGVDSIGYVWFYFKDPDALGNYYRFFTKTIGRDNVFVHHATSVTDDKNVNGQYIEYPSYRGWNPNLTEEERKAELEALGDTPRWAFIRGETVVFKFCTLDAEHYEFWRTIEVQNSSDGNPFASPTSVYTNIAGGALGVWGGYGVYYDTITIQ